MRVLKDGVVHESMPALKNSDAPWASLWGFFWCSDKIFVLPNHPGARDYMSYLVDVTDGPVDCVMCLARQEKVP